MTVRRIKSYSAATGFVYQYHFEASRAEQQRGGHQGAEYLFVVTRDRKHNFEVPILLRRTAVAAWAQTHGRPLSGAEEYAAVKMRLFRAFDESADLERERLQVEVTPENIEALLAPLGLDDPPATQ